MQALSLRTLITVFLASVIAFVTAYSLSYNQLWPTPYAEAQAVSLPAVLKGYAWSSNIGWISFSCENASQVRDDQTRATLGDDSVVSDNPNGTCADQGGIDYGVAVDTDGSLSGHAWSSNIGWIQFGSLSNFPTADGNVQANAKLVPDGGDYILEGWARACAGTVPGDCSTMVSRTDGWDGWISLKGDLHTIRFVGSEVQDTNPDRFAWGSDVVGWIDFASSATTKVVLIIKPDIKTFTATPDEVPLGNNVQLDWDVQGMTSCAASNDRGVTDWDASTVVASNGANSTNVEPPQGTTVYTLSCTDIDGVVHEEQVSVLARPDIIVDGLSFLDVNSLPNPEADGTYDGLRFGVSVVGIPVGQTAPYTFTFGGQTMTGTVDSSPGNTVFTVDNVTFGTYIAKVEVDLPAGSTNDTIAEDLPSTASDEDIVGNSRELTSVTIPPPPPNMDNIRTDRDLIRVDEQTVIHVEIYSSYAAECSIDGNGISDDFITGGDYNIPFEQDYDTPKLKSTSVYLIQCTEPITNTTFSKEVRVEVVPNIEEV